MGRVARCCAIWTVVVCSTPALAVNVNDPYLQTNYANILSNFFDSANAWPSVASLGLFNDARVGQGCTGTLLNSRTILTAAHCLTSTTAGAATWGTAKFSNNPKVVSTGSDRNLSGALANAQYKVLGNYDVALVTVEYPITALTPVRVAVPSDFTDPSKLVGREVTIVGYGVAGTASQPGTPRTAKDPVTGKDVPVTTQLTGYNDEKRRVVVTNISAIGVTANDGSPRLISATFRNPLVDKTAPSLQGQPEHGDSGGPLLIQVGSQWVQIGTVIGGSSGYGSTDLWTWIADYSAWLATNNPLQSVTSKSGTYNWSAPAAWSGGEVPNNRAGTVAPGAQGALGRYFEVNVNAPTTLAVDISPTIDKLTVDHANARLTINETQTLSTVLDTTINKGNVEVAGTLSAGIPGENQTPVVLSRIVVAGGLLSGTGVLTATNGVLQTGGIIAPGSAAATGNLTISGNFVQQAGGTLLSRLSATHSSMLDVKGSATLGGNLLIGAVTGQQPSMELTYTVLSAATRTGTFSSVKSMLAFIAPTAIYSSEAVAVSLARNNQPIESIATNPTDAGVAKELTKVSSDNPVVSRLVARATVSSTQVDSTTKALIIEAVGSESAADALLEQSDMQNALALSSLAGEGLVAAQNLAFSNASLFVEGIRQQSQSWLIGQPAPGASIAGKAGGSSAWVNVQGGSSLLRGDGTNYGINSNGVNVQLGANYQINTQAMVGVAVGGSNSMFSVSDLSTSGNLSTVNLGIFGITRHEDFYAAGTLAYARNSVTANRTVTVFDLNDRQKASFNIDTLSARLELGYRAETPLVNIPPLAAVEPTWLWQSAFSESQQTGGNSDTSLGLNVKAQQTTSLPASLGLQFDRRIELENGWSISPVVRAAWIREFMPQRSINAELQMAPGETFTSYGLSAATNVAQFSLGLLVTDNKTVSSYVSGTAYASDRGQAWQAQLGVNIRY